MEFEEVKYGMLMMVLCDREGRVYDVWLSFGSMHEVRAFRERKKRSVWLRAKLENLKAKWKQEMSANRPKVTEEDVAEVVARWTSIPVKRKHESDKEKTPPYRRRAS